MPTVGIAGLPNFPRRAAAKERLKKIAITECYPGTDGQHDRKCILRRVAVMGLRMATVRARKVLFAVVLGDDGSVVAQVDHVFDNDHSEAEQARSGRDALATWARARTDLRAIVLYEADYSPRSSISSAKPRLRLEGAVLSAARDSVAKVEVMDGPGVGRACGADKAGAIAQAGTLALRSVSPAAAQTATIEAGAAALAALSL